MHHVVTSCTSVNDNCNPRDMKVVEKHGLDICIGVECDDDGISVELFRTSEAFSNSVEIMRLSFVLREAKSNMVASLEKPIIVKLAIKASDDDMVKNEKMDS